MKNKIEHLNESLIHIIYPPKINCIFLYNIPGHILLFEILLNHGT